MDTQSAEQPEFRFLQGKTILFSSICQPSAATTVFIALKIGFIATKTVVTTHEHGNSRQRRRSSWKSSAQLTEEMRKNAFGINGMRHGFVRKYSILRELRIITFSYFSRSGWQNRVDNRTSCRPHLSPCQIKTPCRTKCKICINRNLKWNRKRAKKGLLSIYWSPMIIGWAID